MSTSDKVVNINNLPPVVVIDSVYKTLVKLLPIELRISLADYILLQSKDYIEATNLIKEKSNA